ncbi:hypothetical protein BAE44_0025144, partial [Dichanthelium oligosanthes]
LAWLAPVVESSLADWWVGGRKRVAKELCKGFDTLILLVAWSLWEERNRRIFERSALQPIALAQQVILVAGVWNLAGYGALSSLLHRGRRNG